MSCPKCRGKGIEQPQTMAIVWEKEKLWEKEILSESRLLYQAGTRLTRCTGQRSESFRMNIDCLLGSKWQSIKLVNGLFLKKGEIYLQSVKRYEIRDYDNLIGGAKLMIDALLKEGFIFDDTMKLIGTPRIRQSSLKRWKEGIEEIMGKKGDQLVQAKYNRSKYWDVEHTTIIRTERED